MAEMPRIVHRWPLGQEGWEAKVFSDNRATATKDGRSSDHFVDRYDLIPELARLASRCAELEAALAPLAKAGRHLIEMPEKVDREGVYIYKVSSNIEGDDPPQITYGDAERAARLLEPST